MKIFARHVVSGVAAIAAAALLGGGQVKAEDGPTLAAVKKRDAVLCGVADGRHGFSAPDSQGRWQGLDADFCRAIAAATLGDGEKVKFVPTTGPSRFPALQSGEIDLLSRVTTVTLERDATLGFNFGPPTFYTGTGFMVRKSLGVETVDQLDGAAICVLPGSTTESNISTLFKARGIDYKPIVIGNSNELVSAYLSERCDVLSMDQSALPGQRQYAAPNPDDHLILEGIFSKEPLAIAVRQGDEQWYDIIKWVTHLTFNAEELGVSQANVDDKRSDPDPRISHIFAKDSTLGEKLGLGNDWAYNVIKQVGSYGDIYDRHFGAGSPLQLPRGVNALWTEGGLMYGYPMK